jgi:hypothetical protein
MGYEKANTLIYNRTAQTQGSPCVVSKQHSVQAKGGTV